MFQTRATCRINSLQAKCNRHHTLSLETTRHRFSRATSWVSKYQSRCDIRTFMIRTAIFRWVECKKIIKTHRNRLTRIRVRKTPWYLIKSLYITNWRINKQLSPPLISPTLPARNLASLTTPSSCFFNSKRIPATKQKEVWLHSIKTIL